MTAPILPAFTLETYLSDDLPAVVALLQSVLFLEPMTEAAFARKVLLDPNFDPAGAFVARSVKGTVIGFVLALVRHRPLEDGVDDRERGWITLLGVARAFQRQGVGTALLECAERWLSAQGRTEIWISPYAPHYWTPGVDEAAYPEAILFLRQRGYQVAYRPLSMDLSLVGWSVPEVITSNVWKREIHVEPFETEAIPLLTTFLRREFPGDWQRYVRETMEQIVTGRRPAEELLLAWSVAERALLGFAQSEGERFGPFGVAASMRGQGIGARLLCAALATMRQRGFHNAWFLWTDDRTAHRLYRPMGFRETRRYAVMHKDKSGPE